MRKDHYINDFKLQKLPTGKMWPGLESMIRIQRPEEKEKKQMYLNAGTESINQIGQALLASVTMWAVY